MAWYILLLYLLSFVFSAVAVRYHWIRARYFIHIFQQNGYKRNEYRRWLKEHWDAKVLPWELGLYNIFIFFTILPHKWLPYTFTRTAVTVALFVYGFFWLGSVRRYRFGKIKKPLVLTARVKRLLVPLVLLVVFTPAFFTYAAYTGEVLFLNARIMNYNPDILGFDVTLLVFGWVFNAILIPFWVLLAGRLAEPVEHRIQEGFKNQARAKLASMPQLKIIAITGSYGKTSTKFMVRDLLAERYSVCATPGSFNTPMGICKVINNDLQGHHQVLILEMGARYEGNIQELCDIARPHIAIVTNVGVAHLETFGSQETIAREKGTLVDNLPAGGTAILNADDEYVSVMGENRSDITRLMTGLGAGEVRGSNISYSTKGTHLIVSSKDESEPFNIKLLGGHNVQNLLMAAAAGLHLGIRLKTMSLAARGIEPVEHRLELKQAGDFFVIDDAFNSNPVGARNAVEILSSFSGGKRIIITPGMVELGALEEQENRNFGEAIGMANLDSIILVGKERAKPILEGIRLSEGQEEKTRVVSSLFEANEYLRTIVGPGDVVLYENDLPDSYNET